MSLIGRYRENKEKIKYAEMRADAALKRNRMDGYHAEQAIINNLKLKNMSIKARLTRHNREAPGMEEVPMSSFKLN